MSGIVALLLCAVVALVSCEEMFHEVKEKCMHESGATEDMVSKAHAGTFTDKPEFADFMVCVGKSTGIMDNSGHIHKDVLKNKFMHMYDEAMIDAAIDKCVEDKDNIEETAVESAKCMYTELHK